MRPLVESFTNDELEADLRDLFVRLYDETMSGTAAEIDLYGAPHLGPISLVRRNIAADGLSVLSQSSEARLRYLFKAWRFRNPRRGTHFLATYLRALFGEVYEINQLWQRKADAYPQVLKTSAEIAADGESESAYFLTSRLRVDLTTDVIPTRVANALRTVVPARLVLDIRISQVGSNEFGSANVATFCTFFKVSGASA